VRRGRLPGWLVFFVAGLATLNNAEFGVPCVLASIVALLLGSERSESLPRVIRALLIQAAIGLAGAAALVCVVVLARSGELPDFGSLIHYSEIFGRQGYGLTPMPTLGLHIGIYLTFVGAILAAAVRYVQRREDSTLTAMLGYAGVFGLLTGSYFAGRSLPWQLMLLFPVWGLALALLSWLTYRHLRSTPAGQGIVPRALLPSLATMTGFGVMVAAVTTFPLPWKQVERLLQTGPAVNDVPAEQRFVEDRTKPGESVVILGTPTDHRVAERASVSNVSPWNSMISVYSERDVFRALDALEREGGSKVFLTRTDPLSGHRAPDSLARILVARGFERVADNSRGELRLWRERER
jgi:hypothetical protein